MSDAKVQIRSWESIGRDYHSPYLRNHLWTNAIFKYESLLGVSVPALGIASRNNQIDYLADVASWTKTHEELKAKIIKDYNYFEEIIDKSLAWGETFNQWTKENIYQRDLSGLTGPELVSLFKKFIDGQEDGYAYGTALPTLDFLQGSFVESNLINFLKKATAAEKFPEYYAVFTAPINNSFSQDQEEALLKLMAGYWRDEEWRTAVLNKSLEQAQKEYPDFFEDLKAHAAKYSWVYYVYQGPAWTEINFYNFIQDYLRKGINPTEKLKQLSAQREHLNQLKEKYLRELKPDAFNGFILRIAGKMVWAKPRRKDYQSQSYYHLEKLLREIAKRLFVSLDQIRSLPTLIIEKALNGEEVDLAIANEIKKAHVCLPALGNEVFDLIGQSAEEFFKKYLDAVKAVTDNHTEFIGASACAGQAEGKVKIINLPEEMGKMAYGDILVATATTPSIVPAMKRAAAILTDEGGLTCHAAIVSRELNIPCVVGLKIITKAVKDGDRVAVDAEKGIVRILIRSK